MSIQATLFLLATAIAIVRGQDWTRLPGSAKQISAKGSNLWALTNSGQPIYWVGSKWKSCPGTMTQVSAGYPGGALGMQGYGTTIYYAKDNNLQTPWNLLKYPHFVDSSNGNLMVVDIWGQVWIWTSTAWAILDGRQISEQVVIGADNQIWQLDINGNIQHYSGSGYNWDPPMATDTAMGNVQHISAHNASRFLATDTNDNAWLWNGSVWSQLSGHACTQGTIGESAVYCVDPHHAIWSLTI